MTIAEDDVFDVSDPELDAAFDPVMQLDAFLEIPQNVCVEGMVRVGVHGIDNHLPILAIPVHEVERDFTRRIRFDRYVYNFMNWCRALGDHSIVWRFRSLQCPRIGRSVSPDRRTAACVRDSGMGGQSAFAFNDFVSGFAIAGSAYIVTSSAPRL